MGHVYPFTKFLLVRYVEVLFLWTLYQNLLGKGKSKDLINLVTATS